MKIIHCNLWGDIEISDLAMKIIDTPHFQRLHYIRQTGLSYKVFPGANTTRFEHSIGVYGLMRRILDHIKNNQSEIYIDEKKRELICIAGLVHDLGHGPFSHLFEKFLEQCCVMNDWKHHEQRSIIFLRDLINKYEIDITDEEINFIDEMINGSSRDEWYYYLLNNKKSSLDVDKMDYVLRDSKSFGMKLFYDSSRIIKNCRIIDNEICFCDRIKDEIITIFLIRNKMNRFIYRHHKICEFENNLLICINQDNIKNQILSIIEKKNIQEFLDLNDQKILSMISKTEYWDWECRRMNKLYIQNDYIDIQWIKIKNLNFYSKKDNTKKFKIENWNNISCYL